MLHGGSGTGASRAECDEARGPAACDGGAQAGNATQHDGDGAARAASETHAGTGWESVFSSYVSVWWPLTRLTRARWRLVKVEGGPKPVELTREGSGAPT